MSTNWANHILGAKLIDFSSEIVGCEAENVLDNDISSIWLTDDGIPQWLCLSLSEIRASKDIVIRTIGWHCWHPYSTNPQLVTVHVSSDGHKFKKWDTLHAQSPNKSILLFCIAPISVAVYPFIAFEVNHTFGGNQTYMNKVYLFSDEISAPSQSEDSNSNVSSRMMKSNIEVQNDIDSVSILKDNDILLSKLDVALGLDTSQQGAEIPYNKEVYNPNDLILTRSDYQTEIDERRIEADESGGSKIESSNVHLNRKDYDYNDNDSTWQNNSENQKPKSSQHTSSRRLELEERNDVDIYDRSHSRGHINVANVATESASHERGRGARERIGVGNASSGMNRSSGSSNTNNTHNDNNAGRSNIHNDSYSDINPSHTHHPIHPHSTMSWSLHSQSKSSANNDITTGGDYSMSERESRHAGGKEGTGTGGGTGGGIGMTVSSGVTHSQKLTQDVLISHDNSTSMADLEMHNKHDRRYNGIVSRRDMNHMIDAQENITLNSKSHQSNQSSFGSNRMHQNSGNGVRSIESGHSHSVVDTFSAGKNTHSNSVSTNSRSVQLHQQQQQQRHSEGHVPVRDNQDKIASTDRTYTPVLSPPSSSETSSVTLPSYGNIIQTILPIPPPPPPPRSSQSQKQNQSQGRYSTPYRYLPLQPAVSHHHHSDRNNVQLPVSNNDVNRRVDQSISGVDYNGTSVTNITGVEDNEVSSQVVKKIDDIEKILTVVMERLVLQDSKSGRSASDIDLMSGSDPKPLAHDLRDVSVSHSHASNASEHKRVPRIFSDSYTQTTQISVPMVREISVTALAREVDVTNGKTKDTYKVVRETAGPAQERQQVGHVSSDTNVDDRDRASRTHRVADTQTYALHPLSFPTYRNTAAPVHEQFEGREEYPYSVRLDDRNASGGTASASARIQPMAGRGPGGIFLSSSLDSHVSLKKIHMDRSIPPVGDLNRRPQMTPSTDHTRSVHFMQPKQFTSDIDFDSHSRPRHAYVFDNGSNGSNSSHTQSRHVFNDATKSNYIRKGSNTSQRSRNGGEVENEDDVSNIIQQLHEKVLEKTIKEAQLKSIREFKAARSRTDE